jgi:hypothetical protein
MAPSHIILEKAFLRIGRPFFRKGYPSLGSISTLKSHVAHMVIKKCTKLVSCNNTKGD